MYKNLTDRNTADQMTGAIAFVSIVEQEQPLVYTVKRGQTHDKIYKRLLITYY